MVREETDKKTNDIKARQIVARNVETCVWCIQTERETKVDNLETGARCQETAWYLPHRS